ncbi:MAG: DUF2520 domain-containing protein [Donghicola eburneus]|nr:Rossmann-like and DUF2520 domain-containing protein [Donghicola eburneus]MCI5041462.1 DUF2520 domain-containing protein [Donghicola eburneus]
MVRVNVVGAGKVAQTLMLLFRGSEGVAVQDVYSRSFASAEGAVALAGAGRAVIALAEMAPPDLWLLTVPDDQISAAAVTLAASCAAPSVVVHCSGFFSSDALAPLAQAGWQVASCHPVLSFADPHTARDQFSGTYCAVEGDAAAVALISDLIAQVGGQPFPVNAEKKALYHAAAVFSNNFAVVLQAIAAEAWVEAGVPDVVAAALGDKLLAGAAANVARLGPAAALTGPAARGDQDVLTRQGAEVSAWHPEAGEVYRAMSQLAGRLKASGKTMPDDD